MWISFFLSSFFFLLFLGKFKINASRLNFRIKLSTDIGGRGDDGLIRLEYRIHLCRVTDLSLFLIPSNKKRGDNKTGSNRLSEEMHAAEGGSLFREFLRLIVALTSCRMRQFVLGKFRMEAIVGLFGGWLSGVRRSFE